MNAILNKKINRGSLWRAKNWGEAIRNHAKLCNGGGTRFIVTAGGITMEGDGGRTQYRTKIPKGAESFAQEMFKEYNLVKSKRNPEVIVGEKYA